MNASQTPRVTATVRPRGCPRPIFIHDLHTSQFPFAVPMSSTGPSTDNFTAIFNTAENKYQTLTGKSLKSHPFATQLETCRNSEAISNLLRTQAQTFSKFREGDERLMTWLDPTIYVLSTFSDTLGEGIGLVSSLVRLHMAVLGRPVLSHFHLQR